MPSSCPNGICASGQNDVGSSSCSLSPSSLPTPSQPTVITTTGTSPTTKSVPTNHKTIHETKQHVGKGLRGPKGSRGQSQSGMKASTMDGTQSSSRRISTNPPNTHSVQSLTDQVRLSIYSDNALPTDPRMSGPRQVTMTTVDSEATIPNSSSKLPGTTVASNTLSATVYDPAMVQSYLAQVQGYIPGIPCSAQQCSTCYPVLDSAGYVNNASPPTVQQPMLLTRSLLGGVGSSGASGATAPSPYYVWVGQDAETQKQIYQAQLTLSQMNLNSITPGVPQNYGVQPECSTGMPLVTTNQTTSEQHSGTGPLMNSSPQSDANMYPGSSSSLVIPMGALASTNSQSRAMSESRFPCAPQPATPVGNLLNYSTSNSMTNQGAGLCLDTTSMDNTMWPGNYLPNAAGGTGTGNLWIPPPPAYTNYTHPCYSALSVPVASISSSGLLNYDDSAAAQQNTIDRCYSNPAISIGEKYPSAAAAAVAAAAQDCYYSPGTNLSPGSVWTGSAKIPGPKTYTPFPMIGPSSSIFSSVGAQPQVCTNTNSNNWQMLLSAVNAQKNAQGMNSSLLRTPFNSYQLSLENAHLSSGRRRVPANYAARPVACKEFSPVELQSLKLRVNPMEFDTSLLFRTRYFVIKSDCEYNVHQSIRYGVWCSTRSGNQCLNSAYESVQAADYVSFTNNNSGGAIETQSDVLNPIDQGSNEQNKSGMSLRGHILLFFSVRASGYLNGVAEMIGPVDPQKRCTIWLDSRFRGEIPVRWLYVKNIPAHLIKHISIESYDNRPVTVLRDTSEITPASKGEELLRIVHEYGLPRSVCVQQTY